MIVHVTDVKVVGPHALELAFDNGVHKLIDLRQELCGQVFEPLRDPAKFAQAYLDSDSGTVAWPTGADFAPDYLLQLESAPHPPEPTTM